MEGIYIDANIVWINEKSFDILLEKVNDSNIFSGKSTNNSNANTKIIRNMKIQFIMV
jgi:hypothetical protein